MEKRGEKPSFNTGFDKAVPTYTHNALCTLAENNYLHFVISQNIDGLHHRSGLQLDKLAELHGNVFSEECEMCHTQVFNLIFKFNRLNFISRSFVLHVLVHIVENVRVIFVILPKVKGRI